MFGVMLSLPLFSHLYGPTVDRFRWAQPWFRWSISLINFDFADRFRWAEGKRGLVATVMDIPSCCFPFILFVSRLGGHHYRHTRHTFPQSMNSSRTKHMKYKQIMAVAARTKHLCLQTGTTKTKRKRRNGRRIEVNETNEHSFACSFESFVCQLICSFGCLVSIFQ